MLRDAYSYAMTGRHPALPDLGRAWRVGSRRRASISAGSRRAAGA